MSFSSHLLMIIVLTEVEKQLEQQTPTSTFKKHGGSNSNIQALSVEDPDQGLCYSFFFLAYLL